MLRLLADDMTGALDSAAPFAAARGALPVVWTGAGCRADDVDLAFDSETRDADDATAAALASSLAAAIAIGDAAIAFKKIDSCLRGQPAAEIAAVVATGGFCRIVVAAALSHGRITRGGRQWRRVDGNWRDLGIDIGAELASRGLEVALGPASSSVMPRPRATLSGSPIVGGRSRHPSSGVMPAGSPGHWPSPARRSTWAGPSACRSSSSWAPAIRRTSAQLAALGATPARGVGIHRLALPPKADTAAAGAASRPS